MNAKQKAKSDMCRAVETVCDEHPEIIAELVGFQTEFNKFKVFVAQIFETKQFRSLPLTGLTVDKAADRSKLCKDVDLSHSKFLQMREVQLFSVSQNIHNLGIVNILALKGYDKKLQRNGRSLVGLNQ